MTISQVPELQQHLPFTVLKPYGSDADVFHSIRLQQHLPFTVLKQWVFISSSCSFYQLQRHLPFTVLKRDNYFISFTSFFGCNSTYRLRYWNPITFSLSAKLPALLQQHLPFTVLKPLSRHIYTYVCLTLQQHLPFTVLKREYLLFREREKI